MKTSLKGLAFIARREGLVTVAYPDGKYMAIGYGHNGPDVQPNQTITPEDALEVLRMDVSDIERRLNKSLTVDLDQNQFDCLVSAAYNLGVTGIKGVIQLINARKPKEAMTELERRCRVRVGNNFEVSPGLQRRRNREVRMFVIADYGELSPIPTWRGNPHKVPMTQTPFPGV